MMHMLQFLFDNCSTCFGPPQHPPSGAKTTLTTVSGNRYTVLLPSAIVEDRNQFQLYRDSSKQQYGVTITRCCSYSCFVLLKMGAGDDRNM
jgi:hypothetical protein